MNDFNSRYRNIDDQPSTIRTNAGGFGYDNNNMGGGFNGGFNGGYDGGFGGFNNDMDIMEAENNQKKKQVARASQARGTSKGRKAKRQMLIYTIIIAIEIIALIVIWAMYISYNSGSKKSSSKSKNEASQTDDSGNSGNINVENDEFSLSCTKISITSDAAGNPVALVYFTFANKTDSPLSMSQTYQPRFTQLGMELPTAGALADTPEEIGNKDMQVSNGQAVTCAYAVNLQDTTSEITIIMHDNYETFSDIGSTVVPIS